MLLVWGAKQMIYFFGCATVMLVFHPIRRYSNHAQIFFNIICCLLAVISYFVFQHIELPPRQSLAIAARPCSLERLSFAAYTVIFISSFRLLIFHLRPDVGLLQVCYLVNNFRNGVVEILYQLFVKHLCRHAWLGVRNSPYKVVLYVDNRCQQRVDVVFIGILGVERSGHALRKQLGTNIVHAFFQFSFVHTALNFRGVPAPLKQ